MYSEKPMIGTRRPLGTEGLLTQMSLGVCLKSVSPRECVLHILSDESPSIPTRQMKYVSCLRNAFQLTALAKATGLSHVMSCKHALCVDMPSS